jgi:nucleotide-binding universal stress UspA family protein
VLAAVGTRGSAAVLRAAELLAAQQRTSVHVLGVVEPYPLYLVTGEVALTPPNVVQDEVAALTARLELEAQDAFGTRIEWTIDVRCGAVAPTIVETGRELAAPIIVVGIGRHSAVDRLLGPETSLDVTRLADRPVLAVADTFTELPTTIVVATDFSAASADAIDAALPFVRDPASLTLLHVDERAPDHDPEPAPHAEDFALLRRSVAVPPRVAVHEVVIEGPTVPTILDYARGQGASVIAVGRRGHSWLDRLLVGSVATALLRAATCSVLVTPEPVPARGERRWPVLEASAV